MISDLQTREIFHLLFLRELARKVDPSFFVLKGGVNLRLFFGSVRYSEDIDLDVKTIALATLKKNVLQILGSQSFRRGLQIYGIRELIPPSESKSKQTETTQRFKIHLLTGQGVDLFTKVEFSKRGLGKHYQSESVSPEVLSFYHLPAIIIQHYAAQEAIKQKKLALLGRSSVQARDLFDLYLLFSSISPSSYKQNFHPPEKKLLAEKIDQIDYRQYRDTVVAFLTDEDRSLYDSQNFFKELKSSVSSRLLM